MLSAHIEALSAPHYELICLKGEKYINYRAQRRWKCTDFCRLCLPNGIACAMNSPKVSQLCSGNHRSCRALRRVLPTTGSSVLDSFHWDDARERRLLQQIWKRINNNGQRSVVTFGEREKWALINSMSHKKCIVYADNCTGPAKHTFVYVRTLFARSCYACAPRATSGAILIPL